MTKLFHVGIFPNHIAREFVRLFNEELAIQKEFGFDYSPATKIIVKPTSESMFNGTSVLFETDAPVKVLRIVVDIAMTLIGKETES